MVNAGFPSRIGDAEAPLAPAGLATWQHLLSLRRAHLGGAGEFPAARGQGHSRSGRTGVDVLLLPPEVAGAVLAFEDAPGPERTGKWPSGSSKRELRRDAMQWKCSARPDAIPASGDHIVPRDSFDNGKPSSVGSCPAPTRPPTVDALGPSAKRSSHVRELVDDRSSGTAKTRRKPVMVAASAR